MKLHPLKSSPLSNNAGFTLLEIIAVLVIMGILAVVAVPRYFNLQEEAKNKAWAVGVAEVRGRVNGYFSQQVLSNVAPADIQYTTANLFPPIVTGGDPGDLGDFIVGTITDDGSNLTIPLSPKANSPVAGMDPENITIPRPGAL
jgi:MSHA pilin protein MshA